MNLFTVPWLELSILIPLCGAGVVAVVRDPLGAYRWCLGFTGGALGCTLLAWAAFAEAPTVPDGALGLDHMSAPLVPLVALIHFLVVLATARTKLVRFPFTWVLLGDAVRLATFACLDPGMLVLLLAVATILPYAELRRRGRPTRGYVIHMMLLAVLLALGWATMFGHVPVPREWASIPLFVAVLVCSGTVPFHSWVADLFEHASFGTGLLVVAPIPGMYAAVRLVLPIAPDWVLTGIGLLSLLTAITAAGLASVQTDTRRFFAYLFLSHASLVLVGLELHTGVSLTAALALWGAAALSLSGLGLTIRALEARVGRLPLTGFRGLYDQSPALAVCYLMTGLASVGFPGMVGFVATEMLIDGAVTASPMVGVGVVIAAAVNGIAVLRVYFLLFTGSRQASGVSLAITPRERFAVLTLTVLILGGGLVPQITVASRHQAADAILRERANNQTSVGANDHETPVARTDPPTALPGDFTTRK